MLDKKILSTFSIIAWDPHNGDLGVAVASKFLAAGAVVPYAKAKVGAIATQSWANTSYGPKGLRLLQRGFSPQEVLEHLVRTDKDCDLRQVGIVDAQGRAATYTGSKCMPWAGGITGPGYACQGNILVSEETINAMAKTFERTEGELPERLVEALLAGEMAGGDSRGKQSAALLVVREKGGYGGFNDRMIDLRVDDHPEPVTELKRLLSLHRLYLGRPKAEDVVPIDCTIAQELQLLMKRLGYYSGEITGLWDATSKEAFERLAGVENLEERLVKGDYIDKIVLKFLRDRFNT